jgi:hypothetical protein
MWKHKIIEDLIETKEVYLQIPEWLKYCKDTGRTDINKFFDNILRGIKEATCFYIDDYGNKNEMIHKPGTYVKYEFKKELPFEDNLVETYNKITGKDAFLICNCAGFPGYEPSCLVFSFHEFPYIKNGLQIIKWGISYVASFSKTNPSNNIIDFVRLNVNNEKVIEKLKKYEITPDRFCKLQTYCIYDTLTTLLSCKNISTQETLPSEKLNKKRIKNGKIPVSSYKILVFNPNAFHKKYKGDNLNDPQLHVRLHFCRGHIKTYTEENKLFGMHVGSFWWEPTIRGDKNIGIVDKEYLIK